jgi:hypothetical protein
MIAIIFIPIVIFIFLVSIDFTTRRFDIKEFHPYFARVAFSCFYIFIALLLWYLFRDRIFYDERINNFGDWPRFVWCFISNSIGFALIVSQSRFNSKLPYGPYLFYYPVILIVFSSFIYSIFSIFEGTNNHIFYYLSFSSCFVLAFLIDRFWHIIIDAVTKIATSSK